MAARGETSFSKSVIFLNAYRRFSQFLKRWGADGQGVIYDQNIHPLYVFPLKSGAELNFHTTIDLLKSSRDPSCQGRERLVVAFFTEVNITLTAVGVTTSIKVDSQERVRVQKETLYWRHVKGLHTAGRSDRIIKKKCPDRSI